LKDLHQLVTSMHQLIPGAGWSPLCYACMNGTPLVIKMLLEQKANPNSKTKKARAEVNTDKHSTLDGLVLRTGGESNPKLLHIGQCPASSRSQLDSGMVAKTICLVN
jgi:hypothetical protein